MSNNDRGSDLLTWLISHIFTAGVLAFSMDILRAFSLGVVGALGGLLAKNLYYKVTKKK